MVGRRERVVDVKNLADALKELRSELLAVIGDEVERWSVREDPVIHECAGYAHGGDRSKGYRSCQFGEAVRYY